MEDRKGAVVAIDDLQYLDAESWPLLKVVLDSQKRLLTVMTLFRGKLKSIEEWTFQMMYHGLFDLSKYWLVSLLVVLISQTSC